MGLKNNLICLFHIIVLNLKNKELWYDFLFSLNKKISIIKL